MTRAEVIDDLDVQHIPGWKPIPNDETVIPQGARLGFATPDDFVDVYICHSGKGRDWVFRGYTHYDTRTPSRPVLAAPDGDHEWPYE